MFFLVCLILRWNILVLPVCVSGYVCFCHSGRNSSDATVTAIISFSIVFTLLVKQKYAGLCWLWLKFVQYLPLLSESLYTDQTGRERICAKVK